MSTTEIKNKTDEILQPICELNVICSLLLAELVILEDILPLLPISCGDRAAAAQKLNDQKKQLLSQTGLIRDWERKVHCLGMPFKANNLRQPS